MDTGHRARLRPAHWLTRPSPVFRVWTSATKLGTAAGKRAGKTQPPRTPGTKPEIRRFAGVPNPFSVAQSPREKKTPSDEVFFLTNGGCEIYADPRRNSLDDAVRLCLEGGLDGVVSQVKAIFRNPTMVPKIKESGLSLLTYGPLNNVPEAVYMQHLMGIQGVIVDFVQEIKEAVSDFIGPSNEEAEEENSSDGEGKGEKRARVAVKFSDNELSFLLKLIPELIQP